MASRRDQIQSYQFFMQRVVSAMVTRDTDPAQAPFRRLGGAGLGSIMVAIICLAGVGVYGFMFPGGKKTWQDGQSVIQVRETGALYLFREGRLRPVVNYASALLALGTPAPTVLVSASSLDGTPRGPRIGIPGAPTSIPDAKHILGGGWTLCSEPVRDAAATPHALTVLSVGRTEAGGRPPGDSGLLVNEVKTGRIYVIWHERRYEVAAEAEDVVLAGLGYGRNTTPLRVGAAWLNALPVGEKLNTMKIANRGNPSVLKNSRADIKIGQYVVVRGGGAGDQYFVAEADALVPITLLQSKILAADAETRGAYQGRDPAEVVLPADIAVRTPQRQVPPGTQRLPAAPSLVPTDPDRSVVCAGYQPGSTDPQVLVDVRPPANNETVTTRELTKEGTPLADRIFVQPGYGALVNVVPSADAPNTSALNLVTDLGIRYPLSSNEVQGILGLGGVQPIRLPASLIVRIPTGPALDPAAALRSVD